MRENTLEVRCCCVPDKLLGWIYSPVKVPHGARQIVLTFARVPKLAVGAGLSTEIVDEQKVTLPLQEITVDGIRYYAVKAEGLTIKDLKRVRGFLPNPRLDV